MVERLDNMVKLYLEKIDNYDYYLRDDKSNRYILNIELYNTMEKIEISDIIYIDSSLLKINIPLSFELLNSNKINDTEILIIKKKDKNIYLRRIYG